MIYKICPSDKLETSQELSIVNFLHTHLQEYGDKVEDIQACIDYARNSQKGGNIYISKQGEDIVACSIVLNTGMNGFIPPYILVYIAVDQSQRGKGLGKKLLEFIQSDLKQDIALHVESKNPACHLYKKLGFTQKYLEMRWSSDGIS